MNKKARCLKCVHCLLFNAKGEERYVCAMLGKRLREDVENCKMYKGVKNY